MKNMNNVIDKYDTSTRDFSCCQKHREVFIASLLTTALDIQYRHLILALNDWAVRA